MTYPDQWHVTAHADGPARRRQSIIVLLPYRALGKTSLPVVHVLEGRNCSAVELKSGHARHMILFRTAGQPGTMQAGALQSDAKVFAAGFDPAGDRLGKLEVRCNRAMVSLRPKRATGDKHAKVDLNKRTMWNFLGDFGARVPRHRPVADCREK